MSLTPCMAIPHRVAIASHDAYKVQINTLQLPSIPQCTAARGGCLHQELGQASVLYSPVCHPGLKNKIKLVLLNYLLSAKSRWFSLRKEKKKKGIPRICEQTLTQTDNGGVHAHVQCGLTHATSHS